MKLGNLARESIQKQLDGTVPSTAEAQARDPDALIERVVGGPPRP
jgi:hypothetical protein